MNSSNFKLILILILILIATLFLVQNTQVVNITVILWTFSMSVSIVVVSMLVFGVLIGWFLQSYITYKKEKKKDIDEDIVD